MTNDCRRRARAIFSPRAIIFGLSAFNFGWALVSYLRPPEPPYYDGDEPLYIFLAATLLAASAALAAGGARGNFLAASLSSPLPLGHVLIFWDSARRAGATLFSVAHLNAWSRHELATMSAFMWLASAVSFTVLTLAVASAMRRHPHGVAPRV